MVGPDILVTLTKFTLPTGRSSVTLINFRVAGSLIRVTLIRVTLTKWRSELQITYGETEAIDSISVTGITGIISGIVVNSINVTL